MIRLIVFGTPSLSADIFERLFQSSIFEIVGVVTAPSARVGRKKILTKSPVHRWALEHNLPVLTPDSLRDNDVISTLISWQSDLFLVIAYGKILPKKLLRLMPNRIVNIHPSLLPRYRGPAPMQAALYHGDPKTGVTLMMIDHQMDHGPIISQTSIMIEPNTRYQELEDRVISVSAELIMRDIPLYLSGSLSAHPQQHDKASYVSMLAKQDGEIDWYSSAQQIYNQYRAYHLWPGVYGYIGSTPVHVELSGISLGVDLDPGEWRYENNMLMIGCHPGAIKVNRVKPAGKNWMNPIQFVQSSGSSGYFSQKNPS